MRLVWTSLEDGCVLGLADAGGPDPFHPKPKLLHSNPGSDERWERHISSPFQCGLRKAKTDEKVFFFQSSVRAGSAALVGVACAVLTLGATCTSINGARRAFSHWARGLRHCTSHWALRHNNDATLFDVYRCEA